MGLRISKIRSLLTFTKEILEMERKNATLEYQYYMITEFIVSYSRLLYLVITLVFFFSTLPSTVVEYIFFCGPVLLFYILICGLKKSLKWYFDHEIKRNSEKLAQLQFRKKNVLSEVKEKMKFKDAKDIIEEYSCVKKLTEGHKCQNRKDVSIPELYLRRKRESSVENVVKYVLSEEKENALICKYCGRHNGLALKEEFNYISFRCCQCLKLNPAKETTGAIRVVGIFYDIDGVSREVFGVDMEIMPSKFRSPPPKPPRRRHSDQLTIPPSGTVLLCIPQLY
ncbi:hypothetical protein TNIN_370701 [Trichonephila inaurata madagascariensis]|uniref:Endoplasmic reticulum junction formation protein lunapark n=1 Tax=Trichonephila inaurata madagascariensis TaxID=2747483 RepID=A0A8X6JR91_9ARAC|nr:hypothetical protein TNIN_370701 [Trichonephila inaurata madagascariensis]